MSKVILVFIFSLVIRGEPVNNFEQSSKFKKLDKTLNLINGIRGQALSKLLKLEKKYRYSRKNSSMHQEILLRIAELYYEKGKATQNIEIKELDAKMAAYNKTKKGSMPVLNATRSDGLLNKSVETYLTILKRYPKHKNLDKVLFNLAFSYKELGRDIESVKYFLMVTKKRKKSQLVPEAFLNVAEHYFENEKWNEALKYYLKCTRYKRASSYAFASYKLGWTYYNLKQHDLALSQLEKVVSFGRSRLNVNIRSKSTGLGLIREALKDIVTFYSEKSNTSNYHDYFLKIGGEKDYIWMEERLAKIFTHNGNYLAAISIYKNLISLNEFSKNAPEWMVEITSNYSQMDNFDNMLASMEDLLGDYNKSDAKWVKYHRKNKKLLRSIFIKTEKEFRKYIEENHKIAVKKPKNNVRKKHFVLACDLYNMYLGFYTNNRKSVEIRFFYAEILSDYDYHKKAAIQYALVRDNKKSGKYLEKAAINTIHSYEALVKHLKSNSSNDKNIKEVEEDQIKACDSYIAKIPNGKDLIDIKFKAARLLYGHKNFIESRKRFAVIAEKYPKHQNAVYSVNLMLDSFNIEKNWIELNKWARKFYSNKDIIAHNKGELGNDLYKLIIDSQYKIGLGLERDKKYIQAADMFRDFEVEFPNHKLASESLINSARNYENADKMLSAINMHKKYIKRFPGGKHESSSIKSIAVNYEKAGYIAPSAKYYRIFITKYPSDPDAEKASFNIALYNDMSNKRNDAKNDYKSFLKTYPESKYCSEVIYNLSQIYRKDKDRDNEKKYLSMYSRSSKSNTDLLLKSLLTLGKYELEENKNNNAKQYFIETISAYRVRKNRKDLIVGEKYAAEAQFLIADMYYAKFSAIKLKLPKNKMVKSISSKMKIMQTMNKEYSKVFDFGKTEFSMAALYKIGLSFEDFSKSLFNAPMPTDMTTEEIRAFKAELEAAAFPLEEEAMSAFEKNIAKASELKIGEKWARMSYEKMFKYNPKKYPLRIMVDASGFTESGTIYKVD